MAKRRIKTSTKLLGLVLLVAGLGSGIVLVTQQQLLNEKATTVQYSATSPLRNMKCTFSYNNTTGVTTVRNPVTNKVVTKNLSSEPCNVGRSRMHDGKFQLCGPVNINGCGNVGIWYDAKNEESNYVPQYQPPYCTTDAQCQKLTGKNYFRCNDLLNRCYEDLEDKYCSYFNSRSSCNSAYFQDLQGRRVYCSWQYDNDGQSCRINWP